MFWSILGLIIVILLAIITLKFKLHGSPANNFPYIKNEQLFSAAERFFLGVLEQALGADYKIFGKVRVADVISVKSMSDRSAWQRAFNRISAKHFDFVLCSKNDLAVVAAIELDDQSHQRRSRQKRDNFILRVCAAAGLPSVQIPAQRAYTISEIRTQIYSALGQEQKLTPNLSSAPSQVAVPKAQAQTLSPNLNSVAQGPNCPKCSAPMLLRVGKTSTHAGQKFWGCSTFPKCRAIVRYQAEDEFSV